MKIVRTFATAGLAVAACTALAGAVATPFGTIVYPATKTVAVTDTYFGETVADPFRWLEDPKDPAVIAWAAAQTKLATDAIEAAPAYASYAKRIAELSRTSTSRFDLTIRGGRYVYFRDTPPQAQPQMIERDGLTGPEHVIVDLHDMTEHGVEPAFETTALSGDGTKVAFTTQPGGSEDETIHVVDTGSGTLLPDVIAHAGGGTSPVAIAWDGDGRGFLHTRWTENADGTYATSGILIYHHILGTDPSADTYVFGRGMSPKSEYAMRSSLDGSATAIVQADGDGVPASIYLRGASGPFALVATPDARIGKSDDVGGAFVGDAFYAISKKRHSRGEIVALVPGGSFDDARVVVPASDVVIDRVVPVAAGFMTGDIDGGDGKARVFASDGTLRHQLPIPAISTILDMAGDPSGGPVVIGYWNYTTPNRWLSYDPQTNALSETGIAETSPGDYSNIVAERVLVPALEGSVRIPLEIVHEKNLPMDGKNPTIVYAYGGYGSLTQPFFHSSLLAWLERGGVYAQAMVRGGGEYGDAWHLAAIHENKVRSSNDLRACAIWLRFHRYADRRHLGIQGASDGGFLMGLALTRDAVMYRAVDSEVGIYDLMRWEFTPNGAYNTPEFGSIKNPADFPWMLRQSPLQNVRAGTFYPAVLMTTGENDPRVDPFMSRKMTAMLQANTASDNPIFLIQRAGEGHGIGDSFDQAVHDETQSMVFFDTELR